MRYLFYLLRDPVTDAIFTFVTMDEEGKSIDIRDVVRDDIDDEVQALLLQ